MRCSILNSTLLSSPGCGFSLPSTLVSSLRLTHNKHCQLSLSSGSELIAGIWQFWWNTFGHLSQHINSPPSRHTAHQSSLGSSFCSFLLLTDMISFMFAFVYDECVWVCVCFCVCVFVSCWFVCGLIWFVWFHFELLNIIIYWLVIDLYGLLRV